MLLLINSLEHYIYYRYPINFNIMLLLINSLEHYIYYRYPINFNIMLLLINSLEHYIYYRYPINFNIMLLLINRHNFCHNDLIIFPTIGYEMLFDDIKQLVSLDFAQKK